MISLLLAFALVGFLAWLVITYIPMPDPFKKALVVILVICLIVYLVQLFGLDIPIPHKK